MIWVNRTYGEYYVGVEALRMNIEITEFRDFWEIEVMHMLDMRKETGELKNAFRMDVPVVKMERLTRTAEMDMRHAKAKAGKMCIELHRKVVSGEIYDDLYGENDGASEEA